MKLRALFTGCSTYLEHCNRCTFAVAELKSLHFGTGPISYLAKYPATICEFWEAASATLLGTKKSLVFQDLY